MIATNTTANLDFSDKKAIKAVGNPTEAALLLWLNGKGISYITVRENSEIIDRLPFSTENKYMVSVVKSVVLNKNVAFVKGAPEILLALSNLDEKQNGNTRVCSWIIKTKQCVHLLWHTLRVMVVNRFSRMGN